MKTKKIIRIFKSGVFLIAFFSIVSRLAGLLRDRLLAANFGAGDILDSYYAAFRLPDLIFNTLIFGALGSAFIPQFVKLWQTNKNQAIVLANNLINILTFIVIILTIIFWFFAPQLVPLFTPGFQQINQNLTITLTKIMLLSIIFFSLSTVMSSILNSLHKYLFYSIAPVFYNLGIIIGILFFLPLWGIKGVAGGVILGSILHFLIQLIDVKKAGWRYQFIFQFDQLLKKVLKLMLPRTIALLANQINQIIITLLSSLLKSGSLTIFNFAINIQYLPINIFGISLSTVTFPYFSQYWANNDYKNFQAKLIESFRQILFFSLPISMFLIIFKKEIVLLLLGVGKFSQLAVEETGLALAYFSISIFAQSLLPVITKAFYAQEDTKTPVKISLIAIILNIILAMLLMKKMQIFGLVLSFSLAAIFNFFCLFFIIKKRINLGSETGLKKYTCQILLISLGAIIISYLFLILINIIIVNNIFIILLIKLSFTFLIFSIIFYLLSMILKIKETIILKNFFNLKNGPVKN